MVKGFFSLFQGRYGLLIIFRYDYFKTNHFSISLLDGDDLRIDLGSLVLGYTRGDD